MTPEVALDLFREALWLTAMIVGVLVVPSLLVGLVVAMFQAATQINEQTLSFLPRLMVILLTLIVLGPWLLRQLMEYTQTLIGGWIASFVLPLFRVAALLMTMPVIGTQLVPVRVRLYLALGVCVVLVPNLPPMPQVDALSMKAMLLIGEQILVGALLGFSLQLLFHAFVIAGQIISMQMGLGFASMVDPANGVSVPVLGQFFTMLVTLLFLAMNGHLVVFEVIAESFVTLPVGEGLSGNHFWIIAGKLGWVMGAALLLALPAITALLVVNLAFGAMTRAAPQLNIFSIGFPLTLVLGLVILWIGTADLLSQYQVLAGEALQFLRELVRAR
ncbi:flagellar type III secretion system protein FliR [Pseudomonas aeruginosa]|uniref:flagellar biosynthetic protein FliR n=26 Tax=Gammaproteobacteria TaxID=1236 RepID=UPI0023AFEACB|nr:flagellar biosynthetic protein FliR [Pseudomonas aeruginosa]MCG7004807.1 flagellar type III secretion system protein FliR [Pseudomonas aeruginosa]MCG7010970.1 flagellar type III secretion system protein FliR [Pseudomonas aeruginosa]